MLFNSYIHQDKNKTKLDVFNVTNQSCSCKKIPYSVWLKSCNN